jgi:putative transposase
VRFAFIQAHARIWHVVTMCRVLEVSKTGYYAWRARPLCERVKDDCVLTDKIREIQRQVKQRYGRPRVHMELRALGFPCGKHRVGRLMRTAGLNAKHRPRFRVTTQSEHSRPVTPNVLDRQFSLARNPQLAQRDRVWAADITYIPTRQGWLYLAIVLDLASRRVVGWALRTRLEQELALSALRMALAHRSIRLGRHRLGQPRALHHSDRGTQYASAAYQQLLSDAGFTSSMSRVGDCWDNAVVESFFATLTKELLVEGIFETREQASRELFEFIEIWYNRQRRHSSLGYRTPAEFEKVVLKVG